MVLTAEGDLLLEDDNIESLKTGKWAMVTPRVRFLDDLGQEGVPEPHHLHGGDERVGGHRQAAQDDFRIQQAHEVRDYAARFRPGYWIFLSPGPENTWSYDS